MYIRFVVIIIGIFSIVTSLAQSSFLRLIRTTDPNFPGPNSFFTLGIAHAEDGTLSMAIDGGGRIHLINLGLTGEVTFTQALNIAAAEPGTAWSSFSSSYSRSPHGQIHVVTARRPNPENRTVLMVYDEETGQAWGKFGPGLWQGLPEALASDEGRVLICHGHMLGTPNPIDRLGLAQFDAQGNTAWISAYERISANNPLGGYFCVGLEAMASGGYLVTGTANLQAANYVMLLDTLGQVTASVGFISDSLRLLSQCTDAAGNIYLAGTVGVGNGPRDGFIVRLDNNLNLVWARRMITENFSPIRMELGQLPDGNVAFTSIRAGEFPVIAGVVSSEGELLRYQGYALYQPYMTIGSDNSLYFRTSLRYLEDGSIVFGPTLAKTTPSGLIEGCPQFAACISLEPFSLALSNWTWARYTTPALEDVAIEVNPANFESIPYCVTPPPPVAQFSFPDTLCQGSCASPAERFNARAHRVEWRITGPGTDTLIADTTFQWCFTGPGQYEITQEVWVLGCSEAHTEYVEVLSDDLAAPLGPDRVICTQAPYELMPLSSRPLRQWLWDDGSAQPIRPITASGIYALTASDGYCEVTDSVRLTFIADLAPPPVFTNLQDTTVCRALLPLRLSPQSPYADQFTLNGSTREDAAFELYAEGDYRIGARVGDCLLEQTIRLAIAPCPAPVYLPNAFSPNDDGVNDYYQPQGLNYEGLDLSVYDRWGGLHYQTRTAPFRWDGRSGAVVSPSGAYLVVFTYRNLRTGEEGQLVQNVALVR